VAQEPGDNLNRARQKRVHVAIAHQRQRFTQRLACALVIPELDCRLRTTDKCD
jgi:hypothetical protein